MKNEKKDALFCFRNAVRLGRGAVTAGVGPSRAGTCAKFPVFQGKCLRRWSTKRWFKVP
jgi:hypothetical protein